MAFSHGKNAVLKLNSTDVSQYLESVEMNLDVDTDDIRALNTTFATAVAGLISGALNAGAAYDPALATTIWSAMTNGTAISWEYGPQGSTAGKDKYSGNCLINRWTVSTGTRGKGTANFTAKTVGTIVKGTWS